MFKVGDKVSRAPSVCGGIGTVVVVSPHVLFPYYVRWNRGGGLTPYRACELKYYEEDTLIDVDELFEEIEI